MSKKSKGVVLGQTTPYGVGAYEDAKARLKYQTLLQDYEELQKEADVMRSKLEAAKQRKLMLAAEVRFLRRRHRYLVQMKNMSSSQEHIPMQRPKSLKQTNIRKEQLLSRNEANQHRSSPLLLESNLKKKHYIGKQVALPDSSPVINQGRKKMSRHSLAQVSNPDLNHKGRIHISKEALNTSPNLGINQKDRMCGSNDAALRNPIAAFDLNQDSNSVRRKESSLPSRAPIFDLNEISMGEEDDFQSNVEAMELEDSKKSLLRVISEDQQNDLKLAVCRNAGEGPSCVGKRKISWQDPVALRV